MKSNLVGASNAIYGRGESLKSNSMKILEEESVQTNSSKQLSSQENLPVIDSIQTSYLATGGILNNTM